MKKSNLPQGVYIRKKDDYLKSEVIDLLFEDFRNKCYICEDKMPTSTNVEHLLSQSAYPEEVLCWGNLFLSCTHCNMIKSKKYTNIIDCTKVDPEEFIELSIKTFPGSYVSVNPRKNNDLVVSATVTLLEAVYNSQQPPTRAYNCRALRQKIIREVHYFSGQLLKYEETHPDAYGLRERLKDEIINDISRYAPFAAFKREIIRNIPEIYEEFKIYLE